MNGRMAYSGKIAYEFESTFLLLAWQPPRSLFGYRKFWAHRFGPAPFLPMSRAEMDALGGIPAHHPDHR
jgi:hypothetical protein